MVSVEYGNLLACGEQGTGICLVLRGLSPRDDEAMIRTRSQKPELLVWVLPTGKHEKKRTPIWCPLFSMVTRTGIEPMLQP